VPYDPNTLKVNDEGYQWSIIDARSTLAVFETEADARKALRFARAYNQMCFIGRDNERKNRFEYITEYWRGLSGLTVVSNDDDCVTYDPSQATIEKTKDEWQVRVGESVIVHSASADDANAALRLVKDYHRRCFIGWKTAVEHHSRKFIEYWK
jgi:hypothetical protein